MRFALLPSIAVLAFTTTSASATTIGYTGSTVTYVVSTSGLYEITAYGAQGGSGVDTGGLGAEIGGDLLLTAGEVCRSQSVAPEPALEAGAARLWSGLVARHW